MAEESVEHETAEGNSKRLSSFASEDDVEKMREMIVIPECVISSPKTDTLNEILLDTIEFFSSKITDCEKMIAEASAVSFTANCLQSRIISTELGTKLVKLYEALEVSTMEAFDEMFLSKTGHIFELVERLRKTFQAWDELLIQVDKELEKVAGPEHSPCIRQDLTSTEDISLISRSKFIKNSTLLSYVNNSSYNMMFLEVVSSFSVQECYEHVKNVFNNLNEFHRHSCDILLLTRTQSEGGGFLKLIGMPFRMLLDENEALKHIMSHRQSAVSMAGLRAIHIYAEFICNDHSLEMVKSAEAGTANNTSTGPLSGCVLINRKGQILYNYTCANTTDWPKCEVLLEQVRNFGCKQPSARGTKSPMGGSTQQLNSTVEKKPGERLKESADNVNRDAAVQQKKKCCAIL